MRRNRRLPITDAAMQLGQTYERTRNDLLVGRLTGGRAEHGGLYVDSASVDEMLAQRTDLAPSPTAA